MSKIRILVVEDDPNIMLLILHRLRDRYEVLCAQDGREALETFAAQHVDILITDIMMPRMDGFELVQNLRHQSIEIPVLMLTANQSFDAKRTGFRSGTDDYMTKPINYEELEWRIQALQRRAKLVSDERLDIQGLVLDSSSYTLAYGSSLLELPRKEFELLFCLLSSPGRIFTKTQLLDDIWGMDSDSTEDTIKTHISRLRGRLKDYPWIELVAVKGLGYKASIAEVRK